MTTRQALKDLIDGLPDDLLPAAERSLAEVIAEAGDPVAKSLREAPIDDEPLTAEEHAAIEAGLRSFRQGRGISTDELKRRLRNG